MWILSPGGSTEHFTHLMTDTSGSRQYGTHLDIINGREIQLLHLLIDVVIVAALREIDNGRHLRPTAGGSSSSSRRGGKMSRK